MITVAPNGRKLYYLLLWVLMVSLEAFGYAFLYTVSYAQNLMQSMTVKSFNFYELLSPQVKML